MFVRLKSWWRKVLIWIFPDDEPIEEEHEPLVEEVIRKLLDGDEDREVDGK